ncbi:MAG: CapA family protein [bacterium]|nr:CapA family protein [bacterium]
MNCKRFLKTTVLVLVISWVGFLNPRQLFPGDGEFTISAVGDCIISNRVSFLKDPQFMGLVDILRKADCAYGNCETTFFKPEDGFPAYKSMDPNVFCYPWGADELKWMGFDLMSLANNHSMDFDYDGMFATIKHLDRVEITHAGVGRDLEQAARPGYFETPKGPVALISCSSWLPEKNFQASRPSYYMKGRPGLNPLNVEWQLKLDKANFAKIKELRDTIMKSLGLPLPPEEKGKEVTKLDMAENTYIKGDKIELVLSPNKTDLERIIKMVKIAKRNARFVIVSIHEHIGKFKEKAPTGFQEDFARACIDAGADLFVGTGSHELWGIEIYKGKPIYYSLGNFFFQLPLRIVSPEAYARVGLPMDSKDPTVYEEVFDKYFTTIPIWESVVPLATFDSENKLKEVKLYPISLGKKSPVYHRGTPRLAEKMHAKAIIDRLAKISKRYKTSIVFENGIGKIKVK